MRYFWLLSLISVLSFSNTYLSAQQPAVELIATNTIGVAGQEVQLDIIVNNFNDIIACQASVNWDASLIKFKEVGQFGIKDLELNDFGTTNKDAGHVRWVWTPDDATAVSVEDGTVLFTVTFEVIAENEASATISFTDITSEPPFPIEFANSAYNILAVNTTEGVVTIPSSASDLVNIISTPNSSCDQKSYNGRLEANVNGTTENFIFQWFSGNEIKPQPDFTGSKYESLPAGDYTLRVLNADNQIFVSSMPASVSDEVVNTPDLVTEVLNMPQVSCSTNPEKQTGALAIEVNGEQPDGFYMIRWWKGEAGTGEELTDFSDGFFAEKLFAGSYEVMVENPTTGCRAYLNSVIEEQLHVFELITTTTENTFCRNGANGSASAEFIGEFEPDIRYYWFQQNDAVDSTQAIAKGSVLRDVPGGNYKVWATDLASDCASESAATIQNTPVFPTPVISQRNDSLIANYPNSVWLRNGSLINEVGPYLVPDKSGMYSISVVNEFNCQAFSDDLFFGITALAETDIGISVYPNPFYEFVRIAHPEAGLDYIKVFDARGLLIREFFDLKQKFTDLYLTGSPNGFYLIQMKKGDQVITRKLFQSL